MRSATDEFCSPDKMPPQSEPWSGVVGDSLRLQAINPQLIALVKAQAIAVGLDPALACAVAEQESAWNPWAIRYEPAFYQRYEVPQNLTPTEKTARSISWGLFQTMGETVRSAGYKGDMAALCDPTTGIMWGLIVLQKKLTAANQDVNKALLLWNGGSNTAYPSEVLARVPKYQTPGQ
jgi:soluble lytic murein transglycosylase-like protein